MTSPAPITQAIERLRQHHIGQGLARDGYAINNGLCEDFAADLMEAMGHAPGMEMVCNESFMPPAHEAWDWALLEKHWAIEPPAGLSRQQADAIRFGGHAFVVFEKRFYDAECSEGVGIFFDLPLFARPIQPTIDALQQSASAPRKPKP